MRSYTDHLSSLERWFISGKGRGLFQEELSCLEAVLLRWKPLRLLQVGGPPMLDYRVSEHIHYIHVDRTFEFIAQGHSVCAEFSKLPFESDMFDVIVCPHTHELSFPESQNLFKEWVRVLSPNGALVIFGVHTKGFWWFQNIFKRQFFTWKHRWQSIQSVRKECAALGVAMREQRCLYPVSKSEGPIVAPIKNAIVSMSKKCLPSMGCGYMYIGVKETQSYNLVGALA